MADTVHIILPSRDEDNLSDMLIKITKAIEDREFGGPNGYGLGGAYGYGAEYESPVFMMHRYCWCERQECPWCAGCECSGPEANAKPNCDFCTGKVPQPETGAIGNGNAAPNFWHKPSGLRVWWYKYIGRGMETHALPDDLAPILAECLADIAASPIRAQTGGENG